MNDNDLLNELTNQFKKNQEDLAAKNKLLKELEQLNDKLVKSEKIKSDFLSNIRNEIINPLSSILGLSAIIMNENADPKGIRSKAKLIYEETLKLNFQLRNIFVAAELEAGRAVLEISSVNLHSLIQDCVKDFDIQAEKKNIKIRTLTTVNISDTFYNDAEKLRIIFSNLLANAIEFSHPESEITITINSNSAIFSDTGIGINPQDQQTIFDRFAQLNNGSTKLYAGHGLGLAVVKDLADLLGANIMLNSELGKGSSFKIVLVELNPQRSESNGDDFLFTNDDDGVIF